MATPDTNPAPIIIIRKKRAAHGSHGGAWKVAYADFVTAMMALFIVLWLLSTSQEVQKAVGGYFRDPNGPAQQIGSSVVGTGESLQMKKEDMAQLKEKLDVALKALPEMQKMKDQVIMTITGEGLRVELLETEKGLFFEKGSPHPSEVGKELLAALAQQLGKLPNHILIEGHTDAKAYASVSYSNWDLSTDRANSARRWMQTSGVRPDQVVQVRGFADQNLRKPADPQDASNRRISVIVNYLTPVTPLPSRAR
jgi:chemotaxis protein MotB